MKKVLFFALMGALMLGSFTSCNNKPQEPAQEEIDAQKQALADSVLAVVDACADKYISYSDSSFRIQKFELTKAEKMVKPDYLLDPSEASKFVTKYQKVNALAIYLCELLVRDLYDMPTADAKESIAKLALDINYPIDHDEFDKETPNSVAVKLLYDKCKENGDLSFFWQFHNAVLVDLAYIIANNPDLFFSKITEEQWQEFHNRRKSWDKAAEALAPYDAELAFVLQWRNENKVTDSSTKEENLSNSVISDKDFYIANKDKFIARRNALLK